MAGAHATPKFRARPGPRERMTARHDGVQIQDVSTMADRSALVPAVIAAAATAAAFLFNPSPDRHRARIEQAVAERSPLAGALGIGALKAFASEYHSLGVASYTTVNDRTLSIGALGLVFVLQPSKDAGK